MARKKRKQKLAEQVAVAVKEAPLVPLPGVVAEQIVECFCPVCGRTIKKRAIKAGYITVDHIGYFESIDWDPNKPFGIVRAATGRGSLRNWEYISPEEAPELFEAVKGRFLQALREWVDKKWISQEELEQYASSGQD